ncbi:MAG: hypothetical protein Q7S39_06145 [Ignavibacteria bacterium]|nr:hypothetical protein [Ignavibacteria bacterium]
MHKEIKLPLLLFLLFSVLSFGQVIDSTKFSHEEVKLNIIRETEEQSKKRLLQLLSNNDSNSDSIPGKKELKDKDMFDKPITDLVPVNKIKTVFVPYIKSDSIILSDEDILSLLTYSKLISPEKMHHFHMAPWITLKINTIEDETMYLELMMDRKIGFLILNDGQTYGFILDK